MSADLCKEKTDYVQNFFRKEIKRRPNSGNSCVQNLLFSRLPFKNVTIKLPLVLYGRETWCLTLRE
jgi:hypothetical protein